MALLLDIRFDSRPSNRTERFWRDADVVAIAHFRDAETLEYVDVSGVTLRIIMPGGADLSPAVTPTERSPGIWDIAIADTALEYEGTWRLVVSCTAPIDAVAVRDFIVTAVEPDPVAAPPATSVGPFAAASVAGTGAAVTATLTAQPIANARVAVTWPATNLATPVTFTATVGSATLSAYQVRQADNSQPAIGMFVGGVTYDLLFDGVRYRCLGELDEDEIYRTGIHRRRWFVPGDAEPRVTLEADTDDGRLLGRTGGDGVTLPDYSWAIEADGSVRTYTGQIKTRRGVQVHNEDNPADIADDLAHVLAQVPIPIGRDNRDIVAVDQTQPYVVSTEQYLRVVRANTPLNFIGLQVNWKCQVEVQAAASAVAIAPPGLTWRGTASATQLALSASKSYVIQRTQTQLYATELPDFTTTSAAAAPSYARKVALLPAQSWGVHGEQDLWKDFQAEMLRLGLDPSVFPIQGIARGASPLQQSNDDTDHTEDDVDTATFHWWKTNSTAGPLLTDALAVLADSSATGPGSLSALLCLSFLGISDGLINTTGIGMNDTGDCTIATWSAAHLALQAATRTATGLSSLPWFMIGLPNQPESVFAAGSLTAIRQAQLAVVAGDPTRTFRGAETWDLWRWDAKRHLTYEAQRLLGLRLARAVAAALHSVNTYRGPKIIGAERASSDHKRLDVTIRRDPTSIGGTFALNRPTAPVGFGIIPAGAGVVQGTRSTIKYYSWTTTAIGSDDVLQITTAADLDATPQLLFPDGFCVEARHRSRCVYANDGITLMPLQAHRIGDYVT